MAGKITGRVQIYVNGDMLLSKTGATASGIGKSGEPAFERKAVMSDGGIAGYVEEPIEALLEVTVTDRDDIMLTNFAQIFQNGTIILQAAGGGKSYKMESATCLNNFGLTTGEGETTLRFSGPFWTETSEA